MAVLGTLDARIQDFERNVLLAGLSLFSSSHRHSLCGRGRARRPRQRGQPRRGDTFRMAFIALGRLKRSAKHGRRGLVLAALIFALARHLRHFEGLGLSLVGAAGPTRRGRLENLHRVFVIATVAQNVGTKADASFCLNFPRGDDDVVLLVVGCYHHPKGRPPSAWLVDQTLISLFAAT